MLDKIKHALLDWTMKKFLIVASLLVVAIGGTSLGIMIHNGGYHQSIAKNAVKKENHQRKKDNDSIAKFFGTPSVEAVHDQITNEAGTSVNPTSEKYFKYLNKLYKKEQANTLQMYMGWSPDMTPSQLKMAEYQLEYQRQAEDDVDDGYGYVIGNTEPVQKVETTPFDTGTDITVFNQPIDVRFGNDISVLEPTHNKVYWNRPNKDFRVTYVMGTDGLEMLPIVQFNHDMSKDDANKVLHKYFYENTFMINGSKFKASETNLDELFNYWNGKNEQGKKKYHKATTVMAKSTFVFDMTTKDKPANTGTLEINNAPIADLVPVKGGDTF